MTAVEFLRKRNIVSEDSHDIIIDFENDLEISLVELLDSYYESKINSNMNSDRIREILKQTTYPESVSVMRALEQVRHESKQKKI